MTQVVVCPTIDSSTTLRRYRSDTIPSSLCVRVLVLVVSHQVGVPLCTCTCTITILMYPICRQVREHESSCTHAVVVILLFMHNVASGHQLTTTSRRHRTLFLVCCVRSRTHYCPESPACQADSAKLLTTMSSRTGTSNRIATRAVVVTSPTAGKSAGLRYARPGAGLALAAC